MESIFRSAAFHAAPRLRKLLGYLVEESLAGNPLKESIIGVAVFGRDPGYDSKQDSVVRTEVRRLRAKLIEYYAAEGGGNSIVIDLPKGSYVPAFRLREAALPPVLTPAPQGLPATRRWGSLAAAILLIGVAVMLAGSGLHRKDVSGGTSIPRRSVAVLDFRNLTTRPESAWLASAIPEMLSTELADGRQIRTIAGENVSRMEAELALRPAASPSRETLAAIRRNVGADIVVSGAYADLGPGAGGRVRVDIWAEDAGSGEVLASVSETGTESEILDVMSRAGGRLRAGLRIEATPDAEVALREGEPRDPDAARSYADGLAHMRRADFLEARDLLRRSTAIEPGFAPAHAALSASEARLGYEALAREEGKRAFDLSRGMRNDEARLAIEAQYRDANQEYGLAAAVYARLFARHPDDIEYGLHLAAAQSADARTQDALGTLDALRRLPATQAGDPRIDLEAAHALSRRSDYRGSVEMAAAAARKASAANARWLYAHAISLESGLFWYLGDTRWRGLSQEALAICRKFQDRACVAAILRRFGNNSLAAADFDTAEQYLNQALTIAREIGSVAEQTNVLNGLALTAEGRGDLKTPAAILESLLALGRQTGDKGTQQASLANLGDVLLALGEVDAAREKLSAAVDIARSLGAREALADDLASLCDVYRIEGDLPRARQLCEEALTDAREAGAVNSLIATLSRKARISLAEYDLAAARSTVQEYERLRAGGVNMSVWSDWLLSASLAFASDQPAEAARLANDAARRAAQNRQPWEQARAEALLAESLLVQGQPRKARAAADQAWSRVRDSQAWLARVEVGIACAQVTGHASMLPALISEAAVRHAFELEMRGRLAQAELAHDERGMAAVRAQALRHDFRYLARGAAVADTRLSR
ncbi:MAG: hypothetical protein ABSH50_04055 [Bryobacteraceae bacterium]